MVNIRFYGVKTIYQVNALAEKSAMRGRSRGSGRGRAKGKGRGRATPTRHGVSVENSPQNQVFPIHHKEIEENCVVENVEEV